MQVDRGLLLVVSNNEPNAGHHGQPNDKNYRLTTNKLSTNHRQIRFLLTDGQDVSPDAFATSTQPRKKCGRSRTMLQRVDHDLQSLIAKGKALYQRQYQ